MYCKYTSHVLPPVFCVVVGSVYDMLRWGKQGMSF